jgi:hypothetical protein
LRVYLVNKGVIDKKTGGKMMGKLIGVSYNKVFPINDAFVIGFIIILFMVIVLPWLWGRYLVFRKFLVYLKAHREEHYTRLIESTNFQAMGMFSRDWMSYIDVPSETDDLYIKEMKGRALLVFKYYKYLVLAIIGLGAVAIVVAVGSMLLSAIGFEWGKM